MVNVLAGVHFYGGFVDARMIVSLRSIVFIVWPSEIVIVIITFIHALLFYTIIYIIIAFMHVPHEFKSLFLLT